MYNHESIQKFIDKVNEEADKAAQIIFDKYQPELIQRIKNQMSVGDICYNGMGTSCFKSYKGEELSNVLRRTQYQTLYAGFELPDIVKE